MDLLGMLAGLGLMVAIIVGGAIVLAYVRGSR